MLKVKFFKGQTDKYYKNVSVALHYVTSTSMQSNGVLSVFTVEGSTPFEICAADSQRFLDELSDWEDSCQAL